MKRFAAQWEEFLAAVPEEVRVSLESVLKLAFYRGAAGLIAAGADADDSEEMKEKIAGELKDELLEYASEREFGEAELPEPQQIKRLLM